MSLVSVILPCFNAEPSIKSAIDSICQQTFQDWELLVIDDGSTDNTVEIINSLADKKIKVVLLGRNAGYPSAMNEGIARAQGKFIARMDADDISAPTRLAEQLKALHLHPSAAFCGVARYRITPGGKMYSDKHVSADYYRFETWENLMSGARIFTDPSVMISKEKLLAAGGYRTFQRSGMDVDLWLRAMELSGPCITITKPLFGKRLEPGSIIFNPQTYLINQVPRVLARQRKETGKDDIQLGNGVNLEAYKERGLVKEGVKDEKIGLLYGALVSCLWLGDWKGCKIYFLQLRSLSGERLSTIILTTLKKTFRRVKDNPYEKWPKDDL